MIGVRPAKLTAFADRVDDELDRSGERVPTTASSTALTAGAWPANAGGASPPSPISARKYACSFERISGTRDAVGADVAAPRIVVADGTFAITRRTMFRKLLWTPSDPLVEQGYLYALADAQQQYGVELHHGTLVPTHEHLTCTPREANLPEFLRHLHRESARFLQEHLLAHGYDAPENVWDARSTHVMRLLGASAQLEWTSYSHLNVVAAGLVERVEDYPGWTSDLGLMKGGIVVVKKPPLYFGKDKPDELQLDFTAPPALARAWDGDLDAMVHWMRRTVRDMEDGYRDERRAKGMRVVGAAAIKKTHPFAEPRTARERRGQPVPIYKLGQLGEVETRRAMHQHCGAERVQFLRDNRESYLRWRDGERSVVFPAATYGMRVVHGAEVGAPLPDAVLCVGDELDQIAPMTAEARKELMAAVCDFVRADADHDAEQLTELADSTDGAQPAAAQHESTSETETMRPPAHAVPLASPSLTANLEHPSRIVTLRTRSDREDRGPPE